MSISNMISRLSTARTAIANAIRGKGGTVQSGDGFEDFAAEITAIPSGGITPTGTIYITENGTVDVTNYASADVGVYPPLIEISIIPAEEAQEITPRGSYGFNKVNVGAIQTENGSASGNGTYYPASGKYFKQFTVSVPEPDPPQTEEVVVTPTESAQEITPSAGNYISKVTVNAISSSYVGSAITRQAAKTVTPSSSSQTAVASGRYTTGAVTVAAVPTETKTATANGTVTPTSGKFLSSVVVNIPTYDGSVT